MPLPKISLSAAQEAAEGQTITAYTITLDQPAPVGGLTVNYQHTDYGVAANGANLTPGTNISNWQSGYFVIAAGQTSATLQLSVPTDAVIEGAGSDALLIKAGAGYTIASQATASQWFDHQILGSQQVVATATGDINNDGKVDVVTVLGNNTVAIVTPGDTASNFANASTLATGNGANAVLVADLNHDGKLDFAVTNKTDNTVSVYLRNSGNTGFDAKVDYATGVTPIGLVAADFTGDGQIDLAVANTGGGDGTVSILARNSGNTGFAAKVDRYVRGPLASISTADLNKDGRPDVVVNMDNGNGLYTDTTVLYRNATNTGFDTADYLGIGFRNASVATGDFNGDGFADVAIANYDTANGSVSVYLRNSSNTGFVNGVDYATGNNTNTTTRPMTVADLNGDGKDDIVVANVNGSAAAVLMRNASNTGFLQWQNFNTTNPNTVTSVSVADLNGDGFKDLVIGNGEELSVFNFALGQKVAIAERTGNAVPVVIAPAYYNFTEQTTSQVAPAIEVIDPNGNVDWNGGSLKVQITGATTSEDSLRLPSTNNGGIWLNGTSLMNNTTVIGTANANSVVATAPWTFSFNAAATAATVQSTAQAVSFANNSDTPSTAARQIVFTATDNLGASSSGTSTLTVTEGNDAPTFSNLAGAVASGNEDTEIVISLADLLSKGNQADVDGTVNEFVVKAVNNGTLRIGATSATAADWQSTTAPISASYNAYWKPAAGTNGSLNAFTVVARDNYSLESSTPVQALVNVAAVIDVQASVGIQPVEGKSGNFVVTLDAPAPVGGLMVNFAYAGNASLGTDYTLSAGSNITNLGVNSFTIAAGQTNAVINIDAKADALVDAAETVGLQLVPGNGYQSNRSLVESSGDYVGSLILRTPIVGDFNGDGKLDIAVSNIGSIYGAMGVYLRNASNTGYDTKVDYSIGLYITGMAAGDMNNDGKLDVVLSNLGLGKMIVMQRGADNTGFDAKLVYDVGKNVWGVTVADFNNDGKQDIALVSEPDGVGQVSVLLRNASNTGFDPKIDYLTGANSNAIVSGDFNGDGKQDVAVTNKTDGTVSVLLRNSSNTGFDNKLDYAVGGGPLAIVKGDFNNDGKLDLAVANSNSGTISVLMRNASNSGFDAKVDYTIGSSPQKLVATDLNGDGKSDLVVTYGINFGPVDVLLSNQENNGFDAKLSYSVDAAITGLAAGDFNGDGKQDLAMSSYNNGGVSNTTFLKIFENILPLTTIIDNAAPVVTAGGTTNFTEQTPLAVTSTININDPNGNADWNGGSLKVQITNNASAQDELTLATSNTGGIWLDTVGNYLMSNTTVIGTANAANVSAGTAWQFSFNAQATNALVQGTAQAITFTNNSDAPSTAARTVSFTAADKFGVAASATQNINVTAVNDVPSFTNLNTPLTSAVEDGEVVISFANLLAGGNASDVDGTLTSFNITELTSGVLRIGTSSATATVWNGSQVINALNNAYWRPNVGANGVLNAFKVVAADDLGALSTTPQQAVVNVSAVTDVQITASANIVEGSAAGTFTVTLDAPAPAGGLTVNFSLSGNASLASDYSVSAGSNISNLTANTFTIAAGQTSAVINVNPLSDAVVDPNETVSMNLQSGSGYQAQQGLFAEAKIDQVLYVTRNVTSGDFNGDGLLDMAVSARLTPNGLAMVYLRNASNTGFDVRVEYAAGNVPNGITSADINADGKTDLILATSGKVSVLLRSADNGGFDARLEYDLGTTNSANQIVVADLNGDGKKDIVVAQDNVAVVLQRNASNTGFDAAQTYAVGNNAASIVAADLNGDGKLDLLTTNSNDSTVSVLMRKADNSGYETKVDYATGLNPMVAKAADFNGDGKLDIAVTNNQSQSISVFMRNSSNTGYDAKVDYQLNSSFITSNMDIGDINKDGRPDIVTGLSGTNSIATLLRNASNTGFDVQIDPAGSQYAGKIHLADFNRDGNLDIGVLNSTGYIGVKQNNLPTVTITDNAAPVVTAGSTTNFTEQTPLAVASTISINDANGNADWNGGSLKVQITNNASAQDQLTLATSNNGGIWLDTVGNYLMSNTTVIGTANAANVSAGTAWQFSFNAQATNALVQGTAQAITFANNSDTPNTATRAVTFTASDKFGLSASGNQNVSVTAGNDAPQATNLNAVENYTEDTPLNLTDIVASDVDSANLTVTLTLSNTTSGSLSTATSGSVTSTFNSSTGIWTATGASADVNALLAGVSFTPVANFNGSFNIATSVSDGVAPAVTGLKVVTGTAVNDAPQATNLNAAENYTEDTPLNLTDIVASDIDSANLTVTLTLSNTAAGSLSTATSGSVTSTYNAGTGVWTATGATLDVNALLAGVAFTPAANFNGSFNLATSVSDGVAPAVTGTKAFSGTAVNDAPQATNLNAAENYTEDTSLNLTDIVAVDVDSANLTLTLSLSDTAAGSLSTATSGSVTSTYNAGTGVWTATGATLDVNALLAGVSFTPVANFSGSFNIATSVSDGVAPAVTGLKVVTGTAVNDAPQATNLSAPETYTEDTPLNLTDIVASDVDSANLTVTLTLSNAAAGSLSTATSGSVTSSFNAGTGVWTATGASADVNALLTGVSFTPAADFDADFNIATSVSDGVAPAVTGLKAFSGTAVNDAPQATNLSAAENYTEDTPLNLTDIIAVDGDSANLTVTLTLSDTAAGSLSTATSGSVTSTYNAGTGVWMATGATSDVNALLAGVSFTPSANFNSDFNIATSVSDGVAPAVTGLKAFTATAVNDAPQATNLSALETYTEDTPLNLTDIVAVDVDSANLTVTLTLSNTAAGSLSTATSGSVTSTYNAGTGVWTATGATLDVNALLAGVIFTPSANFNGNFNLATSVSDGQATEISGLKVFTGTPVNDVPQASNLSAPENYTEDIALDLSDIVASDADGGNLTVSLTLSNPSAGSLNTATSGSVTSSYNAGTGQWTASGAIADVNTLLANLSFTPTANFNGSFTIASSVSDGVATPLTGLKNVTGNAVNDAPQASNLNAAESFTEDVPLNLIDIVASDVDSANLIISLTISNTAAGSLSTATNGSVTSTYNAGTGVWSASGPTANVNALLAGVVFTPTANFDGSFDIATSVSDGVNTAQVGLKTITATPVNDAPTATNLNATENYTEDAVRNLTDIVVTDIDSPVTVTLTLSNSAAGSLTTATSGSVTSNFDAVAGKWTATGATSDVNALLAGVSFTPAANFNGNFNLITNVSDGVAPALPGSKSFIGTAVNDAPTATGLNTSETYAEDTPLNLNDIVVTDVDGANVTVTLTLSDAAAGSLNADSIGSASASYDAVAGVWEVSGATADVNALLADLTFTPNAEYNDSFTIDTSVSDGVAAAVTGTKTVTGTAVNDAPVVVGGSIAESFVEDSAAIDLSDIIVSDGDSSDVSVTLTLSDAAAGSLNTATSGAVTSSFSGGVWSASGTQADVNTLLANLRFTPSANYASDFSIATSVTDGASAPVVGSKSFTATAVNDAPTATNLNKSERYLESTPLNLTDIVVSDMDSANINVILTLSSASVGSLSTATSGAVSSSFNTSTGVWTASGALLDVNALLAGVSFTPNGNFAGSFTLATSVSDGVAAPITGSKAFDGVVINVAPTGSPTASLAQGSEDVPYQISQADLLAGFTDGDGDVMEVINLTSSKGSFSAFNSGTNSWTFTPNSNFHGVVDLQYDVSDGLASIAALQSFTVAAVNDVPTGALTISGNTFIGAVLTSSASVADADGLGTFSYAWQASSDGVNWVNISGATSTSYTLSAAEVAKQVRAVVSYTDGDGTAEVVPSNASAQVLNRVIGTAGNDNLVGTSGPDLFEGLAGNDTYTINNVGDRILENLAEGTDLANASVSYSLDANVDNLTLTGTDNIDGTGNALVNTITGNSGNNILNGGAGVDKLTGGAGNDTYIVDDLGEVITEASNAGTDTVISSVTFTIAANVENLTLSGTGIINGTGNTLANRIIGNSAANRINGGTGADTMEGGGGNDLYTVDNVGDVVTEIAGGGTDKITSSVTYALSAEVENLTLSGTAIINGMGNALGNVITGNSAANILYGFDGNDRLVGGTGNDSLYGGNGGDTLSGGTGNDLMAGEAGNDIYVVDALTDSVVENANEGTDEVQSAITFSIKDIANVENLKLTGRAVVNATGNTLDNYLTGNSGANQMFGDIGNDTIDGGSGNDTMVGGMGNDVYYTNSTLDVVTEVAGEGTDTIITTVTLASLAAEVENLTLKSGNISGTGNSLANLLTGSTGNNTLTGGAGNDTLDGGAGTDSLIGGVDNDTYIMGRGYGADSITDTDATAGNTDVLQFLSGVTVNQIWLRMLGNNLEVSIIGTTDKATIVNWSPGTTGHIEQFKTSDGHTLLDTQVASLVGIMAGYAVPTLGQTDLPAGYEAVNAAIIGTWQ